MEQEQLKKLKAWFDDYAAGFYGSDKVVNANLKLKEEHSRRVCEEMSYLTDELGLSSNQKRIADAIAILHDVGRFKQFVKHRTYSDFKSLNHCLLAVEVIRQEKVLEQADKREKELIEKAIEYHGLIEMPAGLEEETLLFARLIRDADKLDIFYVVMEYSEQYRNDPQKFTLELEFPDNSGYSAEVIEAILCGRRIEYKKLQTLNDMMLCQLGWVYDVNFPATLKRIKHRRFLEKIFDFLPKTEDIGKVTETILKYVDSRIEQDK
ncbi:MAG: HD domain-containing protein [Phycisphaerae bacterium]|nr:HD domain-containing protein [Phycisphaerae bacterium]MDD5381544.1 HD domain-containing protein [Phycisphaerae bacterium]